jgi:hypothetical protein
MWAAILRNTKIAISLIDAGASLDLQDDRYKITALI